MLKNENPIVIILVLSFTVFSCSKQQESLILDKDYLSVSDLLQYCQGSCDEILEWENKDALVKGNIMSIGVDSIMNDYYDENAKTLRRKFLKAPLKFGRISSRYNLNRRIKYYGFRIRAHRGTDFAAPIGTPIMSTASGTVTESRYRGGNGNYVKIKHNSTYSTQYLHMKKRNVKVGDYVKQGDVIGWIGMTGNTAGPHVCYRFWKNGKEVDPFKQKLPSAAPIKENLKKDYFIFIEPLIKQIDSIPSAILETTIAEK